MPHEKFQSYMDIMNGNFPERIPGFQLCTFVLREQVGPQIQRLVQSPFSRNLDRQIEVSDDLEDGSLRLQCSASGLRHNLHMTFALRGRREVSGNLTIGRDVVSI